MSQFLVNLVRRGAGLPAEASPVPPTVPNFLLPAGGPQAAPVDTPPPPLLPPPSAGSPTTASVRRSSDVAAPVASPIPPPRGVAPAPPPPPPAEPRPELPNPPRGSRPRNQTGDPSPPRPEPRPTPHAVSPPAPATPAEEAPPAIPPPGEDPGHALPRPRSPWHPEPTGRLGPMGAASVLAPTEPRIQVRIGRVEVGVTTRALPAPPPARAAHGFADHAWARRYLDRVWY